MCESLLVYMCMCSYNTSIYMLSVQAMRTHFSLCCYFSFCSIVLKLQGEAVVQDRANIVVELKQNREELENEVASVSEGQLNTSYVL